MLADALHLGALASAVLGACCVAARASRRRVGLPAFELGMSALMLAAMIDVIFVHALAAVWWSGLVSAAALVSVVIRRSAPRGRPRAMVGLEAVGAIAMAGLLMVMAVTAVPAGAVGGADVGHHGGGSAAALAWLLAVGTAAYAVCALVFAMRAREESLPARLAPATGGASALLMAAAAVCA